MEGKQLRFSKTFWLALGQAVAGLLAIFLSDNPALNGVGVFAMVKSVIDIVVRLDTREPIKSL